MGEIIQQSFQFAEIRQCIQSGLVGVYEIHTKSKVPLKVGIATDLRKRLLRHYSSRQNALKVKSGGKISRPDDVRSKQSILAKHLYFDAAIAPEYNLRTQSGRRKFLEECCVIVINPTSNIDDALEIEEQLEDSDRFRYVGQVIIRRVGA